MLKKLLVPTLVLTMSAIAGIGCRDNTGDATPFPDGGTDAPVDTGTTPDTAEEPDTQAPVDAAPADSSTGDATDATTDVGDDATAG
jgi:hypothetical protein